MQKDENKAFLETKIIASPLSTYIKSLESLSGKDSGSLRSPFSDSDILLTATSVELGLLLLNAIPEYKEKENQRWPLVDVRHKGKRYLRIVELLGAAPWTHDEHYNLLRYFFGEERAVYVRHSWHQAPHEMYQDGHARRSFRIPGKPNVYLRKQIDTLIHLLSQAYRQWHNEKFEFTTTFYDLSLVEQIRYNFLMTDRNPEIFRLWSAAIDHDNAEVFQVLENIIYNKDAVGKITTNIIKALLHSNKQAAWKLVEKLLLSAQRQEGLRQVVLESLDDTSMGAMKYILRVVVDNDLVRFSSVVRALDVWVGMGWEKERETTVKKFLENALAFIEDQSLIPAAIQSKNNADVFMALWAQSVYDVQEAIPYLHDLYKNGDAQKRALALIFAGNTQLTFIQAPLFITALDDADLQPLALAVNALLSMISIGENATYYNQAYPDLFDKFHQLYERITVKEHVFEGFVFSWLKVHFQKKQVLFCLINLVGQFPDRLNILIGYFEEMDSLTKMMLTRRVLPEYTGYDTKFKQGDKTTLTDLQYQYSMLILKDKYEFDTGYNMLYHTQFSSKELSGFPVLLKRTAADFRGNIISLLLRQKDQSLATVMQEILTGDAQQRLAGLDMMIQLKKKKRLTNETTAWVAAFRSRKSISSKEEVLLAQLGENKVAEDGSADNGYGLYDPGKCAPIINPVIDKSSLYEMMLAKHAYGFSMPMADLRKAIKDLCDIFEAHKEEEFEHVHSDGYRETLLLGDYLHEKQITDWGAASDDGIEKYPHHALWQAWYKKWGLQPMDLFLMHEAFAQPARSYVNVKTKQLPLTEEFMPKAYADLTRYYNPVFPLLHGLSMSNKFDRVDEFLLGATTHTFAGMDEAFLKQQSENAGRRNGWQHAAGTSAFLKRVDLKTLPGEHVAWAWNLYNWHQHSGLKISIPDMMPPLMLFCRAYEMGLINEHDLYRGMLNGEHMRLLSEYKPREFDYLARFPSIKPYFEKTRDHILDIELKRGDLPTPVTHITAELQTIFGVDRFVQIIAGLGTTTLQVGRYGEENKGESFSELLRCCYSLPGEGQDTFDKAMQRIKTTDKRLVEVALYTPQWELYIAYYLNWEGFQSAIWWMHAHTKTSEYQPVSVLLETEVARYSSIDVNEFKNGAVDQEWFFQAYKALGAERWAFVYDAAKYISDGNGHRRARIYADVLLGILSLADVTEKIVTKRDQDYVRIYGLAPLNKSNKQKDILARYEFLQQFKKESKQFGAQKQSTEALAIATSMENLARNAGYPDPMRLTWAMETKQVQNILSKETQVQLEDVLIGLVINEHGEADIVCFKDDKQLKSIPAKYKKDKKVEELNGFKKTLLEQFRRSRTGLEEAMTRGDVFLKSELQELFRHPVISRHLEKLVFITGNNAHGFYIDGELVNANGDATALQADDEIRIAHCTDLYKTGSWTAYQQYAFDKALQQPFKQIFRELYTLTEDERHAINISSRYAGHQVQPKQTLALLRSRGWKTNYNQGLQKVYHKEGFAAQLYAMANWFTPAEIEHPTLEAVIFADLKTGKPVAFESIHPRIFSEVMRDIDLVVSVAHAGGVDPEASHSSIEMRAALLQETVRLFKLTNVTVKGSHALIKGSLGEYSVHLGSAIAHRVASGYLSILPVHSQQRGRLFLPFLDDDPRTAELLSKVLLLARDNEIQDPTILQQLSVN